MLILVKETNHNMHRGEEGRGGRGATLADHPPEISICYFHRVKPKHVKCLLMCYFTPPTHNPIFIERSTQSQ